MIDWRQALPAALTSLLALVGGIVLLAHPSDFAADPVIRLLVIGFMALCASLLVLFGLRVLGASDRAVRGVIPAGTLTMLACLVAALHLKGQLWGSLIVIVAELIGLVAVGTVWTLLHRRRRRRKPSESGTGRE
ncbi:hypothetical protein Kfla_4488 [Kribbella flavida DSM 17836]|uniref:Uncharacterized protein n=1 Tax=Kribbella flavida (strain DSM 17836 / JCM 10339 / NBRC 14399) TaxID=479435 RepID=D2PWP9_KRIFD|nr:hypothetical protein [Kribbella flavida]ADB33518.1 hypothetical protein Kfla_4488 [Kribbella flavida DSM 17836]